MRERTQEFISERLGPRAEVQAPSTEAPKALKRKEMRRGIPSPQPTTGSEEPRELPHRGPGRCAGTKRIWCILVALEAAGATMACNLHFVFYSVSKCILHFVIQMHISV